MKTTRDLCGWRSAAFALALTLAPTTALAQTEPARAAFDRGMAQVQSEQFALAAASFEESYRLRPVPVVLFNLAGAYDRMGRARQAIETYERYLREAGETLPQERTAFVRDALTRLRGQLSTVTLRVTPRDYAVEVDGRRETPVASALTLDPGRHVLTFTADGHAVARRELDARAGASTELDVTLTASAATNTATPPDPRVSLTPSEEGRPVTQRWWFWTGVGVAAAGVAVGIMAAAGVFTSLAPAPDGLSYSVDAVRGR
ncbi:MAG: hypothetical protein R3A52_01480 [Polyangiales bacterium]